jgi:YHS domain-containing protein
MSLLDEEDAMTFSRKMLAVVAVLTILVAATAITYSLNARSKGQINTIGSPGVAIKGFDPVAYFTDGKPRKGSNAHSYTHKGVEWQFVSEANKAKFIADPAKFEPAYGGYCAYGVAQGYLVKIEGSAWSIKNGKLYLNYDAGVQDKWSKNPSGYISEANERWPKLVGH